MRLELKKFDISKVRDDAVIVMTAKRREGKSTLVKDLMYYHRDIPVGTVISPTEQANKFFSDFIPNVFIHDEYSAPVIENFIKRQKMIVKKQNQEKALYGSCNIDPRAFLILDDCLYDASWTRDKNMRFVFQNGRHVKTLYICTMQYPLGIPPNLRTNIDYVFILRENNLGNRKRLYENYAGVFPSFDIFCQVMDQCTENYECLVIDNTARSNKLEDIVFWYRAEVHSNFRVGNAQFWVNNDKSYNTNDDDEEDFDTSALKKSKHIIRVAKRV
jgi:hypothetical protein